MTGATGAAAMKHPRTSRPLNLVPNGSCSRYCGLSVDRLGETLNAEVLEIFRSGARAEVVIEFLAEKGIQQSRASTYAHKKSHLQAWTTDDAEAAAAAADAPPMTDSEIVSQMIDIGSRQLGKATRISPDMLLKLIQTRLQMGGKSPFQAFLDTVNNAFDQEAAGEVGAANEETEAMVFDETDTPREGDPQ